MQSELGLGLEGLHMNVPSYEELKEIIESSGFHVKNIGKNQEKRNSWWHITLTK